LVQMKPWSPKLPLPEEAIIILFDYIAKPLKSHEVPGLIVQ